jgi:hypothetical protein
MLTSLVGRPEEGRTWTRYLGPDLRGRTSFANDDVRAGSRAYPAILLPRDGSWSGFDVDLGARVIKAEAPGHGDDTRGWGPPFVRPVRPVRPESGDRESTYFLSCNRNKASISLDLKSEADTATLAELVRRADVERGAA